MATMVPNRRSTFGIICVQCHEELIAPDKSEYRAGTHIRHLWHCSNCSARFESIVSVRPQPVLVCLPAVGYSAGLPPVSLARVCLACYSGTDFLVGWLASLQSSACYYKSFWS